LSPLVGDIVLGFQAGEEYNDDKGFSQRLL
jgi:hypothetical protein